MSEFIESHEERHGLFRNVPRSLRRAVERRLARLEADEAEFDRAALVHHARLKRLHALLHVHPAGERVRSLFGRPAPGSARAALRQLARLKRDPAAAADLVRRHRLPYLLVEAALGDMPEPVALALVEALPAEELVARLPLLAGRELIAGRVRTALVRRLAALAGDRAVSLPYQKVEAVVRKAGLDRELAEALFALVAAPAGPGGLEGGTALVVDGSPSMARAGGCLEMAASVGWRIDRALEAESRLYVYLCGTEARELDIPRGSGVDRWRHGLSGPAPGNPGTSLGTALEQMVRDRRPVSRVVVVTDGYENRAPRLAPAFARYGAETGLRPTLHLVQPADAALQLAMDLKNAQVPFAVFTADRHLLGLDVLIAALAAQSTGDRLAQILAYPGT
jgi:hypothetical protein